MEEARRLLARLDRIEALKLAKAGPGVLLTELRALLREGEAWRAAEGEGPGSAADALAGIAERLSEHDLAQERDVRSGVARAYGSEKRPAKAGEGLC